MRIFRILFLILLTGCASEPEKPEPKVHAAALSMDTFPVEQGMPVRDVKQQEFFFKHCQMESRRAFTTKVEYSCSEKPF